MTEPISYLIAHTPRAGSHWLCDVLQRNGLGIPKDERPALFVGYGEGIKGPGPRALDTFFENRLAKGGGLCGVKTDLAYLEHLGQQFQSLDFKTHIFSHVTHYILLTREDMVAQAVSWYLAKHTGYWTSADTARRGAPPYDRAAIDVLVHKIKEDTYRWQGIIKAQDAEPLTITYEDMLKFGGMARAVKAICKHIGVAAPKPLDTGSDQEKLDVPQQAEYVERYNDGE